MKMEQKERKREREKERTRDKERKERGKLATSTTPASVGEGFEGLNPTRLWGIWLKTGSLKIDKALPSVTPACNAGGRWRPTRQRHPPALHPALELLCDSMSISMDFSSLFEELPFSVRFSAIFERFPNDFQRFSTIL